MAAYALLFAEFFLRLYAPVPLMPRYVTAAPYGVRMNIPNSTYWHTNPDSRVEFRINSQGMRADRDYADAKPPGTCRILMLGDSFFMGYEVALEESIQYLLEKKLNEAGYKCEVLNLAVSGMGPAESLLALEHVGRKFSPDIVLLEMHRTNLDNNIRADLLRLEDGRLVPGQKTYLPGVATSDYLMRFALYRWAIEHCQLYSAVREKAAVWIKSLLVTLKRPGAEDTDDNIAANGGDLEYKRALNLAITQRIEEVSRPAKLLLLEIPDRQTRTTFSSYGPLPEENPYKATGQYITVIDELRAAAGEDTLLYYERGQGHMTPLGTRITVEKLAQKIIDSQLLERYRQN